MEDSLAIGAIAAAAALATAAGYLVTRPWERMRRRRDVALRLAVLEARVRRHAEVGEAHLFWALLHDRHATRPLLSSGEVARCREHALELLSAPAVAPLRGGEPVLAFDRALLRGAPTVATLLERLSRETNIAALVADARRRPLAAPASSSIGYRTDADADADAKYAVRFEAEQEIGPEHLVKLGEEVFALSATEARHVALVTAALGAATFGDYDERTARQLAAKAAERAREASHDLRVSAVRNRPGRFG